MEKYQVLLRSFPDGHRNNRTIIYGVYLTQIETHSRTFIVMQLKRTISLSTNKDAAIITRQVRSEHHKD